MTRCKSTYHETIEAGEIDFVHKNGERGGHVPNLRDTRHLKNGRMNIILVALPCYCMA